VAVAEVFQEARAWAAVSCGISRWDIVSGGKAAVFRILGGKQAAHKPQPCSPHSIVRIPHDGWRAAAGAILSTAPGASRTEGGAVV